MNNPVHLECSACVIRTWRADDAEDLARHANNPKVADQMRDRFPRPYTLQDARNWIEYATTATSELTFAIEHQSEAVGSIGLIPGTDIERFSAEIGYWLGEDVWGRGIATAAVECLTQYAFDELAMHRVFALPFATNMGSQRVLEKAGFVREGILEAACYKNSKICDQVMFARVCVPG